MMERDCSKGIESVYKEVIYNIGMWKLSWVGKEVRLAAMSHYHGGSGDCNAEGKVSRSNRLENPVELKYCRKGYEREKRSY